MSSPRFGERVEDDPSICYRHPDRHSWVLCQRCGRTICPECQILAPVGTQCPECVREGSTPWDSRPNRTAHKTPPRVRATRERSAFTNRLLRLLKPGGKRPPLSWFFAGSYVFFWLVGLLTGNAPFRLLAAAPGAESWQLWRYFTNAAVTPAFLNLGSILSIVLHIFFWLIFAPMVEKHFGKHRFLLLFFTATAIGSVGMVTLANSAGYGLASGLFGLFGAYAVVMWSYPPVRMQIIIVVAFNLMLNLALGGGTIPLILGGLLAGAGVSYILIFYADRPRSRPETPYLIIAGVLAVAIILAITSSGFKLL